MSGWGICEHLPTRKGWVRFDGTNGSDIVRLVNDPRLAWLGELGELIVMFGQGELTPSPGDIVVRDGEDVYPIPPDRWERQYRVVSADELDGELVGERS